MLGRLLAEAVSFAEHPTVIRYPRGNGAEGLPVPPRETPPGRGELLREGADLLVIACGTVAAPALAAAGDLAAEGRSVAVYDPIWIKPAPFSEIEALAAATGRVLTVEDGASSGGFGEHVASRLAPAGMRVTVLGIPDAFQPHATRERLLAASGLDRAGIAEAARRAMA